MKHGISGRLQPGNYVRNGLEPAFRAAAINPEQRLFECRLRSVKHS